MSGKTILLAVDVARREFSEHVDATTRETLEISRATGDRVVVLPARDGEGQPGQRRVHQHRLLSSPAANSLNSGAR